MNISQLPLTHSIALSHGIINFSAFSLLTSTTLSLLIYCHLSLIYCHRRSPNLHTLHRHKTLTSELALITHFFCFGQN